MWDYKVVDLTNKMVINGGAVEQLRELGKDGWELVTVVAYYDLVDAYLKRRVPVNFETEEPILTPPS